MSHNYSPAFDVSDLRHTKNFLDSLRTKDYVHPMQRHADTNTIRTELRNLGVGREHTFRAKVEAYLDDHGHMRVRLRNIEQAEKVVASHCFLYVEDVKGGMSLLDRIGALQGRYVAFVGHVKMYNSASGMGYKLAVDSLL
jgi:hypothetical protein